jgi:tetratricopeptide (TPR) repeat protein
VTRRRIFIAGTVAALAATVLFLGGALRESGEAGAAGPVRRAPTVDELVRLGLDFQQKARETGDASYYTRSEAALRRALGLEPGNRVALGGLGSLALARHQFGGALVLGRRAGNSAVIGDALVELGRYDQAFATFDRLGATKPNLSAYARVSYGRELVGDVTGAIRAMRLAVEAATGRPEPTAWTHVQLGKLYWSTGRLQPAAREYGAALTAFPGYVHALDGLAQVAWARGHIRRAIQLERRAVETIPLPQFAATLGDLYTRAGNRTAAKRQYGLIGAIDRLLAANGVRTDLESALFRIDHGIRLKETLELARAARRLRPSIDGDDVLAWALARNGRCREALAYSKRALRLGTNDALKFFHRSRIERCLGRRNEADRWLRRALDLNPHFSVRWAPR